MKDPNLIQRILTAIHQLLGNRGYDKVEILKALKEKCPAEGPDSTTGGTELKPGSSAKTTTTEPKPDSSATNKAPESKPVVSPKQPVVSPTQPVVSPTQPVVSPTDPSTGKLAAPTAAPQPGASNPAATTVTAPQPDSSATNKAPESKPVVSPTQPVVSPTQPVVSPTQPVVSPTQPVVSPTQPVVSPTQPVVSPTDPSTGKPAAPTAAPQPGAATKPGAAAAATKAGAAAPSASISFTDLSNELTHIIEDLCSNNKANTKNFILSAKAVFQYISSKDKYPESCSADEIKRQNEFTPEDRLQSLSEKYSELQKQKFTLPLIQDKTIRHLFVYKMLNPDVTFAELDTWLQSQLKPKDQK